MVKPEKEEGGAIRPMISDYQLLETIQVPDEPVLLFRSPFAIEVQDTPIDVLPDMGGIARRWASI